MSKNDPTSKSTNIHTDGGSVIDGNVTIGIGDFIGRDKITHIHQAEEAYDVRGLPNPYLGLRPYSYEYHARYAGRAETIVRTVELLTALGEQRSLIFITGASGSGKSSFAQAGLLPALEQHYRERGSSVRLAVFRPGHQPMAGLAESLRQLGLVADGFFASVSPYSLGRVTSPASEDQISLVVIDQFEEFFTQSDPNQRDQCFTILESLPPFAELRMHIITTMRADYLSDLFAFKKLYEYAKVGIELRAMRVDELQEAIQQPIRQMYLNSQKRMEDGLVVRLAQEAATDATYLPLLQVTLEDLWRRGSLKYEAYNSLTDAIHRRADEVFTTTTNSNGNQQERCEAEQVQILAIFLELVEVSLDDNVRRDVRRQRPLEVLIQGEPLRRRLIQELSDYRLLSIDLQQTAQYEEVVDTVNIIHESLITNWHRLQEAIVTYRENLQRRSRFEHAFAEWHSQKQNEAYLLSGVRLAEAEELATQRDISLRSEDALTFLRQSVGKRERQRRQQRNVLLGVVITLSVLLVAALVASGIAINARNDAKRRSAITRAEQLAAHTKGVMDSTEDPSGSLALLLAREAVLSTWTTDQIVTENAEIALRRALELSPPWLMTLEHEYPVYFVAFSKDSKMLITATTDNVIYLWNIDTRLQSVLFKLPRPFSDMHILNSDGNTIATINSNYLLQLWDVTTGQQIKAYQYNAPVVSVGFCPTGLQVVSEEHSGTYQILETNTGKRLSSFGPFDDIVQSVAFTPDCQGFAVATGDNVKTFGLPYVHGGFGGHNPMDRTTSVAFSADGKYFASGSTDLTVNVQDVGPVEPPVNLRLYGHELPILHVAFSPNNKYLSTASDDGTVRIWAFQNKTKFLSYTGHSNWVLSAVYSSDGQRIISASSDGTVRIWNAENGDEIAVLNEDHLLKEPHFARFSNDNKSIVAAGYGVRVWTGNTEDIILDNSDTPCFNWSVDFSREDQHMIASCSLGVVVWDAHRKLVDLLSDHSDLVWFAAFSPDSKLVVDASEDGMAYVWDIQSKKIVHKLTHGASIRSAEFSPDGKHIITAGVDKTIKIWDTKSGIQLQTLSGHKGIIWSAMFSPSGKQIVSASDDRTVRIWDADSGKEIHILTGHQNWVRFASFRPDGQRVVTASADRTIRIWDVNTGKELLSLKRKFKRPDNLSIDELIHLANSRIQRNRPILTEEEMIQYGIQ